MTSAAAASTKSLHAGGCLFCRRSDRAFVSREHPFPEALGNQEIVLPRGVVCDPCNHGVLSQLDQALVEFPPIATLRVMHDVETKSGAPPVARWGNAVLRVDGPANINVKTNSKKAWVEVAPNHFEFRFSTGRPFRDDDCAALARALWKTALELIYLDDNSLAFDPKFDDLRATILGERAARGWLAFAKKADPVPKGSLTWHPGWQAGGKEIIPVEIDLFGMRVYTELLERRITASKVPDELGDRFALITFGTEAGA
jgi:hypothetical protein